MPYLLLARTLLGLSARAAYPVGAPIYLGLAIVASVLFGPTGMRASDVTRAAGGSVAFTIALWSGWLLLALPIARAAFAPRSALFLRWMPAPRWIFLLAGAGCLFAIEAPFILLFGRGAGLLAGFVAGILATAGHSLLLARSSRPLDLAAAALFGFAVVARPAPALLVPIALVAAVLGVRAAFRRAPEIGARAPRSFVSPRSPLPALAVALAAVVIRGEAPVIGRALALGALGGLVIPLAALGHDLTEPSSIGALSIGVLGLALAPGLSGIGAAVMRAERSAEWLLDAAGTPSSLRAAAAAAVCAAFGAAVGLGVGALAAAGLGGASRILVGVRVVAIGGALGAAIGAVLAGSARVAGSSPKRADRNMLAALLWAAAAALGASSFGERSLLLIFAIAAALVVRDTRRAGPLRHQRGFQ
ncbi:hypothetical protein [Polyangium aurulentum]|uniref:hypothetical protein n=1 Tax=Polyangium aurulentum TaxID=2567896 RepID=UPI0010ADB1D2|nr:hypothetical protein [Polyangium aurulentum]UQA57692.1 hypothetical protein E8A73_041495 [Polyangium aurulentum]